MSNQKLNSQSSKSSSNSSFKNHRFNTNKGINGFYLSSTSSSSELYDENRQKMSENNLNELDKLYEANNSIKSEELEQHETANDMLDSFESKMKQENYDNNILNEYEHYDYEEQENEDENYEDQELVNYMNQNNQYEDDSMNDITSLEKQYTNSNSNYANKYPTSSKLNYENENILNDGQKNRYSLVDLEFFPKNSNKSSERTASHRSKKKNFATESILTPVNNYKNYQEEEYLNGNENSNQSDEKDMFDPNISDAKFSNFLIDLKDTSIDEILLIADDTATTSRMPFLTNQNENIALIQASRIESPLNLYTTPRLLTNSMLNNNNKNLDEYDNEFFITNQMGEEHNFNYDFNIQDANNSNMSKTTSTPLSKPKSFIQQNIDKIKNRMNSFNKNKNNNKQKESKTSPQTMKSNSSSIMPSNKSNTKKQIMVSSPVKDETIKQSSSSIKNVKKSTINTTNQQELTKKTVVSQQQQSQQYDITYSIESDESIVIENLLNDPNKLKEKLKQNKIEREQLNQLQENYVRLLEQYAEAENFIDAFRLGMNANFNKTPTNSNMLQDSLNSQNKNSSNSQNELEIVLRNNKNNRAFGKNNTSESKFMTNSLQTSQINNTDIDNNTSLLKSEAGVLVIKTPISSSGKDFNTNKNSNDNILMTESSFITNTVNEAGDLVVEQSSKLGILVQVRVLEDKMQSFLTLINENQLNNYEKNQVFENIKTDYEKLITNYDEAKQYDNSNMMITFGNDLDMDLDLNLELNKMKDLLSDIVEKMKYNLIDEAFKEDSENFIQKRKSPSILANETSFGNHQEIMEQYNRLIGVFNYQETSSPQKVSSSSINNKSKIPTLKGSALKANKNSQIISSSSSNSTENTDYNVKSSENPSTKSKNKQDSNKENNLPINNKNIIQSSEQNSQKLQSQYSQQSTEINNKNINYNNEEVSNSKDKKLKERLLKMTLESASSSSNTSNDAKSKIESVKNSKSESGCDSNRIDMNQARNNQNNKTQNLSNIKINPSKNKKIANYDEEKKTNILNDTNDLIQEDLDSTDTDISLILADSKKKESRVLNKEEEKTKLNEKLKVQNKKKYVKSGHLSNQDEEEKAKNEKDDEYIIKLQKEKARLKKTQQYLLQEQKKLLEKEKINNHSKKFKNKNDERNSSGRSTSTATSSSSVALNEIYKSSSPTYKKQDLKYLTRSKTRGIEGTESSAEETSERINLNNRKHEKASNQIRANKIHNKVGHYHKHERAPQKVIIKSKRRENYSEEEDDGEEYNIKSYDDDDDDESQTSIELDSVDSVIEVKRPQIKTNVKNNSKKNDSIIKRLNNQVETLKQRIMKDHLNKMSRTTSDVEHRYKSNRNNHYSEENEEIDNESTLIETSLKEPQIEFKPKIKFIKNVNAGNKNNKKMNIIKRRSTQEGIPPSSKPTLSCKEQQKSHKKKSNQENDQIYLSDIDFQNLKLKHKSRSLIENSHLESTRYDFDSSTDKTLVNYSEDKNNSSSTLTPSRSSSSASLSQSIQNNYHRHTIFQNNRLPTKTKSCYFFQDIKKSEPKNFIINTNHKRTELQNSSSYNCLIQDSALTDTSDMEVNRKHKLNQLKQLIKQQELQKYQLKTLNHAKKSCKECNKTNFDSVKSNQMTDLRKITKSLDQMNMLSGSRQSISTGYDNNKGCSSCKLCLLSNTQNKRTKTIINYDFHNNNNLLLNQQPVQKNQQQAVPAGATHYFLSQPNGEIIYCDASGRILGLPLSSLSQSSQPPAPPIPNLHSRSSLTLNSNQYVNELDQNLMNVIRQQQFYSSQTKLNNHASIHHPSLSSVQILTDNGGGAPIRLSPQPTSAVHPSPTPTQVYSSKSSGLNYMPQQEPPKVINVPQQNQTYSLPQTHQIYAPFIPIQKPIEQNNSQINQGPRKVRYYIREYGDTQSDMELLQRSNNSLNGSYDRYNIENISHQPSNNHNIFEQSIYQYKNNDNLDNLMYKTIKYALSLNSKSNRIRRKVLESYK